MRKMLRYATDHTTDSGELTRRLNEFTEEMYQEYKHQKELLDMEERIYKRLEKRFDAAIVDQATPALKDLRKQLDNLVHP